MKTKTKMNFKTKTSLVCRRKGSSDDSTCGVTAREGLCHTGGVLPTTVPR